MKINGYLNIKDNGTARFTKKRTGLDWNEIAIKISVDIPNELFRRPIIEAKIEVSNSVLPKHQPVELIINTKDLIEQSTGAKINFSVIPYEKLNEDKNE